MGTDEDRIRREIFKGMYSQYKLSRVSMTENKKQDGNGTLRSFKKFVYVNHSIVELQEDSFHLSYRTIRRMFCKSDSEITIFIGC